MKMDNQVILALLPCGPSGDKSTNLRAETNNDQKKERAETNVWFIIFGILAFKFIIAPIILISMNMCVNLFGCF